MTSTALHCAPSGMTRLQWSKQRRPKAECGLPGPGNVTADWTNLIPLRHILGPVHLEPEGGTPAGTAAEFLIYNHFVR